MAILFPTINKSLIKHSGGEYREIDTLDRLEKSLPQGYEIFHDIDWQAMGDGHLHKGQFDVLVMNRQGDLLILEIKAGNIQVENTDIFKQYSQSKKNVTQQLKFQYSALLSRLKELGLCTKVHTCLVLPDHALTDSHIIGHLDHTIIDAKDFHLLGQRVKEVLPLGVPKPDHTEKIRRFLLNALSLDQDVSIRNEQHRATTIRIADGLATWVPRIHSPSQLYHIKATAGSGKTQLAIRLLNDAAQQGQTARYVCFNRPLADYLATIAPVKAQVHNFHELADHEYRKTLAPDTPFDVNQLREAEAHFLAQQPSQPPSLDLLIIDEAQDFQPEWIEALLCQLKATGKLYLLEDPNQALYQREGFQLPEATLIESSDNYRSPRQIVALINLLGLTHPPIKSLSPWEGDLPTIQITNGKNEETLIAKAIKGYLEKGYQLSDIVILSSHGLKHSYLLNQDTLWDYRIRRFTGQYDQGNRPLWTEGNLYCESVYRFKGQSAPIIIFCELDFTELTEATKRKLFVGLSRAQMEATLIISQESEACLQKELAAN